MCNRHRTVYLPAEALAHPDHVWSREQTRRVAARVWFEREPEEMVLTEMTRAAGSYDQTLTLLHLPDAERVWREPAYEDDDEGWAPGSAADPQPQPVEVKAPWVWKPNPVSEGGPGQDRHVRPRESGLRLAA